MSHASHYQPAAVAPAPDDRITWQWMASRRLDGSATLTDPRGTRQLLPDGDTWLDSLTGNRIKFGYSIVDDVVACHFLSDEKFDRLPGIFIDNRDRKPSSVRDVPWDIEG